MRPELHSEIESGMTNKRAKNQKPKRNGTLHSLKRVHCRFVLMTWGALSHSARTPIITLFIPGTSLKTTHLQKRA